MAHRAVTSGASRRKYKTAIPQNASGNFCSRLMGHRKPKNITSPRSGAWGPTNALLRKAQRQDCILLFGHQTPKKWRSFLVVHQMATLITMVAESMVRNRWFALRM